MALTVTNRLRAVLGEMVHTLNPNPWETDRWISEFRTSLLYIVSSRTARITSRDPVSKREKVMKNVSV